MNFKGILLKIIIFGAISLFFVSQVLANPSFKTKFYNFEDLLIDGKIKKPQILYIDPKQKVKFSKLLKLKKSFLGNLSNTRKDPSLR